MAGLSRCSVIRVTYLLTVIQMTCLFMQFSVLLYLANDLGLDSLGFGLLQTTFGLLQLLGSPVFGRLCDRCGARAGLTLSFAASCCLLGLLLLGPSSGGLPALFLSRLPALLLHPIPGAQMVVTDLTSPAERPDALGKLGLGLGVGLILGPLLGGILSTKFGIYSPIYVALGASVLGAAISASCIPANTKMDAQGRTTPGGGGSGGVFSLKETWRLLTLPRVLPVFAVKVLSGFPAGIFLIMLSVISVNVFGLEARQTGYLMSYFGVIQMVTQGLVIGRLTSRYSESALLRFSVLVLCAVGLAMALMTTIVHFCLLVPPLLFGLVSVNILTDSILTKAVSPLDTGAMLGLCACVQPLMRTVGPTLGGFLYQTFGVSSLGYLQFVINLGLTLFLWDGSALRGVEKLQ
ncbi:solute carrier family 22 member 18 [Tachyglossus aculeatus]|uniref:solute carrier family 22 member 18 n=1 Tax=Tachyglossus aculeatus TaxID=9261 RepID=UPI0018F3E0E3|nr:solute carrier family 22 member 18 [Tachyglossus aculeatus]